MGSVAVSESQLDESRQLLTQARSRIAITDQKLTSLAAELGGPHRGASGRTGRPDGGTSATGPGPSPANSHQDCRPRGRCRRQQRTPGGRTGPQRADPDQPAEQRESVGGSQSEGNPAGGYSPGANRPGKGGRLSRPGMAGGGGQPQPRRRFGVRADPGPECQRQLGEGGAASTRAPAPAAH